MCGGELGDDQLAWDADSRVFIAGGKAVRFTDTLARLFDAIWRSRRRGGLHDREVLMQAVYGHKASGGPEDMNVVNVHLTAARRLLAGTGYTISYVKNWNRGQTCAGYNLVEDHRNPFTIRRAAP
jgi:hypothetical protein